MSRRRSPRAARLATAAVAVALVASGAGAQPAPPAADTVAEGSWRSRVGVGVRWGQLQPAGGSELYALLDRALTPGARPLRPRLAGVEVRYRVLPRWTALAGAEGGATTIASASQARAAGADATRQRTRLEIADAQYVGAEWRPLRGGAGAGGREAVRLVLGAGAGVARYRLRQWGTFIDAEREIAYADDFRSSGRGAFGYAAVGVEVPVHPAAALQAQLRRQVGSAPMGADYAAFDRLDLGGTRISFGVVLERPAGR